MNAKMDVFGRHSDVFGRHSYKLASTVAEVRTAAAYRGWNLLEGGTSKLSGVMEILYNATVLLYMGVYICYQTCLFLIKQKTNKNMGVYNVSELYT